MLFGDLAILNEQNNHQYIDLFIANFTHEEITQGLTCCIRNLFEHQPSAMQKLIDHKADPNQLLWLRKDTIYNGSKERKKIAIDKAHILCDNGAFDETMLTLVEEQVHIFTSLRDKLKKNQPK